MDIKVLVYALYSRVLQWREDVSRRRARRQFVDRHTADLIVDSLEEAVHRGSLTRSEVNRKYRQLASLLDSREYLPKHPNIKELKGRIKNRLGTRWKKVPEGDLHTELERAFKDAFRRPI